MAVNALVHGKKFFLYTYTPSGTKPFGIKVTLRPAFAFSAGIRGFRAFVVGLDRRGKACPA